MNININYRERKETCDNLLVIRSGSPNVSGAVHQPGNVQGERVPGDGGHVPSDPGRLAPGVPGHEGGHEEGDDRNEDDVNPENESERSTFEVGPEESLPPHL